MLVADDARVEDAARRGERVHGRVDAELGDLAREHRGGVEVGERGGGRRVGQVVGRHVDGLHRRDRAVAGGGDALLQRAHLGGQRRLVAHGGRHAAEQGRHLGAGLREAEDVVDEQQHVLLHLVAEVLGHGQAGQADAQARAGRLVHLPEDERGVLDDPRLAHLEVEVVALARALAHAAEDGEAAVLGGDVVDQLLHDDRLADAGAAEQADLAPLGVGGEQVDDLDAGLEDLVGLALFGQGRRRPVDRGGLLRAGHRALVVDRRAEQVEQAAEALAADRHADRAAGVEPLHPAHDAVGGVHGHAAHDVVADVLRDLGDEVDPVGVVAHADGVEDLGQMVGVELQIQRGPDHLHDLPVILGHGPLLGLARGRSLRPRSRSIPA